MKLYKFPIPPTVNRQYMPSRGRLIKSTEARQYDTRVETFVLLNKRKIEAFKEHAYYLLVESPYLSITTIFVFHRSKLLTKKDKLKKIDVSNRLKSCHDNFAKVIGLDDSHFVNVNAKFAICEDEKDEQVIIELAREPINLLHFEDII